MTAPAILFVCLGNICRSPLAEAAFRKAALDAGLEVHVDSAGTANYHVSEPPDPRSISEAARHGIDIRHYRGRQLVVEDFHRFDWIIGMDASNMSNIARLDPGHGKARVELLLDLVPGREGADLADPWYGGEDNFRDTWEDVSAGAAALVKLLS
jgi:protein-tyrosine phosphatase